MLQKLHLKNFKCFDEVEIDFSNLNLLIGTNSSGKSSIIQSILLIIHNITNNGSSPLNGKYVSLGSFNESANYIKNAKTFSLKILAENEITELTFKVNGVSFQNLSEKINSKFNLKSKAIKYIPANRIGYENLYPKSFDEYDELGVNAQFTFDYFENNKNRPINQSLLIDNIQTLEYNVNHWLKQILNTYIRTAPIAGTDNIKTEYSYHSNNYYVRPKNIGSGVSYVVSVLISCLFAKPNDLIIIENPEIHLHPKAQSILSEFFVFVAKAGIQLIIETHSDHIFNGVRKAVNKYSKDITQPNSINKDLIKLHFFVMDYENLQSQYTEIKLNDLGGITNYQKLLFDQFDDDLDELLNDYTHEFDN